MAESVNYQEEYMKLVKKEFVEKVKFFLEHKLSQRKSWTDINKHLKIHLYNILKKTKDQDLLERDQKDEIVNAAFGKISPIIEKKVEQEAKERPRPKYPAKLLKKSFALQYLTRRKASSGAPPSSRTPQRNKSATMNNRSRSRPGNTFGMGSLARALNEI